MTKKHSTRRLLSARAYALQQLQQIETQGTYVALAGDVVPDVAADAREERQATDYVAGVTRWRRWLDFILAHFYRGDLLGMDPPLRHILRLGLYDLLVLETPPHAALNEAVELARVHLHRGAAGLVNGLLRNVERQRARLPEPHTGDPAEDLAIRHSHPTWMVRRWLDRIGADETRALLEWNNARPVYGLRVIQRPMAAFLQRLDALGASYEPSPYIDYFIRTHTLQPVLRAGLLAEGACAVQDESAGLVVRLLDPQPGETIIDTCAAPGGKALHAAQLMGGEGHVLACDIHENRLRLVTHGAKSQRIQIVATEVSDLRDLAVRPDAPQGDRVLLDAPCSGLGVLSKRADLRWNRRPEDLAELATLQDALLDAASRLVRPGGLLVYSTCTTEPEENQERVVAFLARNPAFRLEPAGGILPADVVTPEGFYATWPQEHGMDGAFGARLRRAA